jgi:hypothetical protein
VRVKSLAHLLTPRAALVAVVLAAFAPAIAQRGVYFYGDVAEYLPRLAWAGEQVRSGHMPGWNPHMALGVPATMGFSPVDLLFFVLLPKEWAYNLDLVFHLLLAALGMFALARRWGQSNAAAAVAGAVWCLGGFTQGHLQHFNIVVAVAWAPVVFLAVDRILEAPSPRSVSLAALALGLDLLGGHIQIVLYTGLAAAAYAVLGLVRRVRAKGMGPAVRAAVGLAVAAVGALGIGLVFLWPFVEWTRFIGAAANYNPAAHTLTRAVVVRMVAPFWTGGSVWRPFEARELVEHLAYTGLLPLGLAVVGLGHTSPKRWFLAALAVVAYLLARGPYGPLWSIVASVPLLSAGRTPVRYVMFVPFAVALLAGFGLDAIARRRAVGQIMAGVLGAAAVGLAAVAATGSPDVRRLWGRPDPLLLAQPDTAILLATLVGAAALLFALSRRSAESRRPIVVGAALAFAAADVVYVARSLPFNELAPRDSYAPPPSAEAILARDDRSRVYSYSPEGEIRWLVRDMLGAGLPIALGLRSFSGAGNLEPLRHTDFMEAVKARFERRGPRLLGLFTGGYVVSRKALDAPGLTLIHSGAVKVYANEMALPLAYFAARSQVVADADAALRMIVRADFDPRMTVVVEEAEPDPAKRERGSAELQTEVGAAESAAGSVSIERDTPDRIELTVATGKPAWLVLNEAYGPGWRATVDGQPAPVRRANFLVRTVPVPAGTHHVEFVYAPRSRDAGMLASAATFAVLAVMAARRPTVPPLPKEPRCDEPAALSC